MKKVIFIGALILLAVCLYMGMNYYTDNLAKIVLIQRQQIAAIGRELRSEASSNQMRVLMLFFAYGALHSLGPGHGKSIISGIFLSERRSLPRVLLFSGIISYLQGFTAFLLVTLFSTFGRNLLPQDAFKAEEGLRFISAFFILIIGAFILYRNLAGRHSHGENSSKTSIGAVVLLGLTPCFGTVNLLLFLGALGLSAFQLAGAFAVSTGMFVTITIFGCFTISVKSAGDSTGGGLAVRMLETAGPLIMIGYSLNILRSGAALF